MSAPIAQRDRAPEVSFYHVMRRCAVATAFCLLLLGSNAVEAPVPWLPNGGPGWWSVLPAVCAIGLAVLTREVILALIGGIYVGVLLLGSGPLSGLGAAFDVLINACAEPDHVKILMFTMLMGGLVGVISLNGGTAGLLELMLRFARTPRRASIATWGMGMLVFFDDYASTLLVGNTMRPVTDRLNISREKLAYLVDSTAAPVASLALISTWIGYEVSVLNDAMVGVGLDREGYEVFVSGLPWRFYQFLCLGFVAMIALTNLDFGSMWQAENRARRGGGVLAPGARPLMDDTGSNLNSDVTKGRYELAVVPIVALLLTTLSVIWSSGLLAARSQPAEWALAQSDGLFRSLGFVLGQSASYDALVYGAGAAVAVAVVLSYCTGAMSLGSTFDALVRGMQAMVMAVLVLVLAWGIGAVMESLQAGPYLSGVLSGALPLWSLPSIAFLMASLIALSTGSSWATMAVLFPIVVPLVLSHGGEGNFESVFLATTSAVLGGAVFGDHCSPISDTTVLSSIACASDHVDHTRTQAPYAIWVAIVSLVFGYLPAGFGWSPWLLLVLSSAFLFLGLRIIGRPVSELVPT